MTILELIKPVTWFPPMWAYLCGAVSTGLIQFEHLGFLILGIVLCGPIVCGMSQAANDWCDRHVDAINEPNRPIPSGRMPPKWGLGIAIVMSLLSLIIGWFLGKWGFIATIAAVTSAWIYSVEPFRLKKSGIFGPVLVGFCYEGLPWFTGAAVLSIGMPSSDIVIIAILYASGAFGIMTLNDFKAIKGDKQMGIKSLPVIMGKKPAAQLACLAMIIPQIVVVWFLFNWNLFQFSFFIIISIALQLAAMEKLLRDPQRFAPWYNQTGVTLYVFGMMISAIALGSRTVLI
jgi:chlorophyll synthase